jgi:preprotein translocase subunit SecA
MENNLYAPLLWERHNHKVIIILNVVDDDESDFLNTVDRLKSEAERKRIREEKQALEEYRKSQDILLEEQEENKKKELLGKCSASNSKQSTQTKNNQTKLLLKAVVKRQNSCSDKKEINRQSSDEPPSKKEKSQPGVPSSSVSPHNALSALGNYDSDSDSGENEDT